MRVLIAEDEVTIAKALKIILEKQKFSVDIVDNGLDALNYIKQTTYETIVLDIMMPEMDGLEVLKILRNKNINVPILLLTAKSEIEDRVIGLNLGADDYLPKPFATSEFVARVKALCRRNSNYIPSVVKFGNVNLDCNTYEIISGNNKVKLNNKEYQIMEMFISYPHMIFSTEHLMEKIWGFDTNSEIDVVWTYIGFLRKKLKQINANVEIKTIRGVGYSLEEIIC